MIRKIWLKTLKFIFFIGSKLGIEECNDRLEDIEFALNDELIDHLIDLMVKAREDPGSIRHLYKE